MNTRESNNYEEYVECKVLRNSKKSPNEETVIKPQACDQSKIN